MNIYKGYTKKQLKAVKETLRNFYYGKDLKHEIVRKLYQRTLKLMKKKLRKSL